MFSKILTPDHKKTNINVASELQVGEQEEENCDLFSILPRLVLVLFDARDVDRKRGKFFVEDLDEKNIMK